HLRWCEGGQHRANDSHDQEENDDDQAGEGKRLLQQHLPPCALFTFLVFCCGCNACCCATHGFLPSTTVLPVPHARIEQGVENINDQAHQYDDGCQHQCHTL